MRKISFFLVITLSLVLMAISNITMYALIPNKNQYREQTQQTYTYYTYSTIASGFDNTGYCFQNQPYTTCREWTDGSGQVHATGTREETVQVPHTGTRWSGWSGWKDCNGSCPTATGTRQIETRVLIPVEINTGDNSTSHVEYKLTAEKIPLQQPNKTGYTFDGWELEGAGSIIENEFTTGDSYSLISAKFVKNTYTVTFNGFKNSLIETKTVEYDDSVTPPEIPEVEGYTSIGWDNTDFSHITEDKTYTAQYQIKSYPIKLTSGDTVLVDKTLNHFTKITIKDKDNKTVEELIISDNLSKNIQPATYQRFEFERWDVQEDPQGNITIRPIYINKFLVRFLDVHGEPIKQDFIVQGENATPPTPPTLEGYTFIEWNPSDFTNIQNDTDIQAIYEIKSYPVKITSGNTTLVDESLDHFTHVIIYDKDGTIKKEIEIEGEYNENLEVDEYYGYHFNHWDVKKDELGTVHVRPIYDKHEWKVVFKGGLDGTVLLGTAPVKHMEEVIPPEIPGIYGYKFSGFDKPLTNISEDQTITALYIEDEDVPRWSVTFTVDAASQPFGAIVVNNSAVFSTTKVKVLNGTPLSEILPNVSPFKEGKFRGYFINGELVNSDGIKITGITDVVVSFYSDVNDNNIDDATEKVYVVFDSMGGSEVPTMSTALNSRLESLPSSKRDGYEFKGWYTSPNYGSQFSISSRILKDITLYAKWAEIINNTNDKGNTVKPCHEVYPPDGYWDSKTNSCVAGSNYRKSTGSGTTSSSVSSKPTTKYIYVQPTNTEVNQKSSLNRSKTFKLKFTNPNNDHIEEQIGYYGERYYVFNENNIKVAEYEVKQLTEIKLPQVPEVHNGMEFDKWTIQYDKYQKANLVSPRYLLIDKPIPISQPIEKKCFIHWIIFILDGILTVLFIFRIVKKVRKKERIQDEI